MKKWFLVSEGGVRVKIESKHLTKGLAERARNKAEKNEGVPSNPILTQKTYVVMHESEWKRKNKKVSLRF